MMSADSSICSVNLVSLKSLLTFSFTSPIAAVIFSNSEFVWQKIIGHKISNSFIKEIFGNIYYTTFFESLQLCDFTNSSYSLRYKIKKFFNIVLLFVLKSSVINFFNAYILLYFIMQVQGGLSLKSRMKMEQWSDSSWSMILFG